MEPTEVYSNEVVSEVLPNFQSTLAHIVIRDYEKNYGFSDQVIALDLDAYEKSLGGDNKETVDAAFGIASYANNKANNPRILLVEFRMKYKGSAHNSHVSDMKCKELHSRNLLSNYLLDNRCFFVFSDNVAPLKRSEIERTSKANSSLKKWKIVNPSDFQKQFHFVVDLPYKPITDTNSVLEEAKNLLSQSKVEEFLNLLDFWCKKEEFFYVRYEFKECETIQKMLFDIIRLLESQNLTMSEDDQIAFDILNEQCLQIKNRLSNAQS